MLPLVKPGGPHAWLAHIDSLQGRLRGPRLQNLPDRWHLIRRARDQRHLAPHQGRGARRDRASAAPDVGSAVLQHNRSRSLITSGDWDDGFALPAAIGAKIALSRAEVWVVVATAGSDDDARVATAVQEHLDINIAIINNGSSAWSVSGRSSSRQALRGDAITGPNFAKLADAFGIARDRDNAATSRARSKPAAAEARGAHRFPGRAGNRVLDGAPGADLHKMIRRPSPIVGRGD